MAPPNWLYGYECIFISSIKCLNSLNKPTVREDIEGVQIAMGVNQAYEAVSKDNLNGEEIRQEQEQEEHIYDVAV